VKVFSDLIFGKLTSSNRKRDKISD
jgi:hypothetical protein